ncbi:MAG: Protein translocase subunit SecA [Parcubacteria group bacterium GW2011_GWA1_36_12]|nr:MAG: Protein translocase subunit SecA [Parcubacteria group bacterium GW2011_GWA1_36_12]
MRFLNKIFGDANEKYLKNLRPIVVRINSFEEEFKSFSEEQLKNKTAEFKEKIAKGENLDDILPEAFALTREAAKRVLNQRHFDVQLVGGIVLHQGKIAEMKTGEGKTLTATLPLYLNALDGKGCHLVTVNDYLAKRDAVWMGQIFYALGLSTGCIVHDTAFVYDPEHLEARNLKHDTENIGNDLQASSSKIQDKERDTIGGFKAFESYLRPVSRREAYEADITYGTNNEFGFDYLKDNMVYSLEQKSQRDSHFAIVDEVDSILIDEARTPLIISAPDQESSKWYQEFARIVPKLNSEVDYEIDEKSRAVSLSESGIAKIEKILGVQSIYEEKGIKYLHHLEQAMRAQAINPKDGRPLFSKDRDYIVKNGQIIIIDEFTGRLMPGRRWSGGLHQAIEAKEGVQVQPESLTLASITFQNLFRMYKKIAGMTGTAATSAEEFHKVYGLEVIVVPSNKPMVRNDMADLIFKTTQGKLEAVVKEIKERHQKGQPILVGTRSVEKNEYLGKLLEREGIPHQILNAKNHEREGEIIAQAGKPGAVTIATNMAGRGVDIVLGGNPSFEEEASKVRETGGLYIVGTERHEARRIDNQLRGRAGRQGDPGASRFFVSLDDDLMRIFGGDRIKAMMETLKIPEDQPIEAKLISGAIESAQAKIEGMNFDLRKHLLDYDDVLNKHREIIYKKRLEFLETKDFKLKLENLLKTEEEKKAFAEKEKELGEKFNEVAKFVCLKVIDALWLEHLEGMDYIRDSVRLRAYGQQDPLVEYKAESHKSFKQLLSVMDNNIMNMMLRVSLVPHQHAEYNHNRVVQGGEKKVGRNDPCPCGSGKKFKKCHGK